MTKCPDQEVIRISCYEETLFVSYNLFEHAQSETGASSVEQEKLYVDSLLPFVSVQWKEVGFNIHIIRVICLIYPCCCTHQGGICSPLHWEQLKLSEEVERNKKNNIQTLTHWSLKCRNMVLQITSVGMTDWLITTHYRKVFRLSRNSSGSLM